MTFGKMLAVLLLLGGSTSALAQKTPAMSKVEAAQLFTAAGFPIVNNRPTDPCGAPANPAVTFIDMNGDKKPEALFIDKGRCYLPDTGWFSIAAKGADGKWRKLIGENGQVRTVGTATGGWFNLQWTSNGKTYPLRYDGQHYVVPGKSATTPAAPGTRPSVPAIAAKPTVTGAYPTDGWKLPMKVTQLKPAELDAIYRAAGFTKIGKVWKGCENREDASISDDNVPGGAIQDVNGDGRPEVFVFDQGTFCYGNTGTAFRMLTPVPGGWKLVMDMPGFPTVLTTKGVGGWRDIEAGGPGFCQPVFRWNGKEYDNFRQQEYQKGACARR